MDLGIRQSFEAGRCSTAHEDVWSVVVAIIQFKESGDHTLRFENNDEEFREWHFAQCKRWIDDSLCERSWDLDAPE